MSELSVEWDVPPSWWAKDVKPPPWKGHFPFNWKDLDSRFLLWVDESREAAQDPYLWWFLISGPWSMLDDKHWPERIYFSAERNQQLDVADEEKCWQEFHLSAPAIYKERRFLTLVMDVTKLRTALAEKWKKLESDSEEDDRRKFAKHCAERISAVQFAKCFHRIAMGVPIEPSKATGPSTSNLPEDRDPRLESAAPGEVVVGLIDDGLPYLHRALRQGNTSRLVSVWDQRWQVWRAESQTFSGKSGFGYGAVSVPSKVNSAIARLADGLSTESGEYSRHGFPQMRRRSSHGAAVLHLLAGDTQAGGPPLPIKWPRPATASFPVIGVQIPFRQSNRRSLAGWLAVHAIDGLNFIAKEAKVFTTPKDLLVNLSLGAFGGPHDGSSIVDGAFDELVGLASEAGTRLVTIAATGNTAGTQRNPSQPFGPRLPSGIHACGQWTKDSPLTFTLKIPPHKAEDTFLEIWFDQELPKGLPINVILQGPGSIAVERRSFGLIADSSDIAAATKGVLFFRRVSQSLLSDRKGVRRSRSMILIALAPTRALQLNLKRVVPAGEWTVTLSFDSLIDASVGESSAPVTTYHVDAWVERDDTWVGSGRGQQARLVAAHGLEARLTDENTFTSLAHSGSGTTAGAIDGMSRQASPYSAEHKEGKVTSYSAVADRSPSRRGILVSGTHTGTMRFGTGTSMAAPQVTRSLANMAAPEADRSEPTGSSGGPSKRDVPSVPEPSDKPPEKRTSKKGLELP